MVCIASLVNSFLVDGTINTFGVFLPEYMEYFNSSVGYTSLANGLQGAIYPMIGRYFTISSSISFACIGVAPLNWSHRRGSNSNAGKTDQT